MARAVWKGPFVEESLMKKVDKYKTDPKKIYPIGYVFFATNT